MKESNLSAIKDIAKTFLHMEPKANEEFPFIIEHPFLESQYTSVNGNFVNVLESEENYNQYINELETIIDKINQLERIYYLIRKPYSSAFLKYTYKYLNNKDLGKILKFHWQNNEYVNIDKNISKLKYVALFKKCGKELLMTDEELETFNEFPEKVKIYRGINNYTNHPVNGLSWTINKEQAIWFAKRFDEGGILCETEIEKEHILAYFNYENETVIDIHFLKNIKETPIH